MTDHDDVVSRVADAYVKKGFLVQTRSNNLPQGSKRTEAIYRPDMLVKDEDSREIISITEVETNEAGKSVIGATILADVCMQVEIEKGRQRLRPNLIFIFYRPSANLGLAEKRLSRIKKQGRIKYLGEILVLSERDVLAQIPR